MKNICDLVLYLMVSTSPGVEQKRIVYINHKNAEAFLEKQTVGRFVDFDAVEEFECAKGPKENK